MTKEYTVYQILYRTRFFRGNVWLPMDPAKVTFSDGTLTFQQKQDWAVLLIMCENAEVLTGLTCVWQDEAHANAVFELLALSQNVEKYEFRLAKVEITKTITHLI